MKNRTITIKKGSTPQSLFDECKKLFPCYSFIDLSQVKSDRTAKKKGYSITFKDNVEADEEHQNKSAEDIKREGLQGITLEERLQLELDYFKETGKHLDIDNITLCSGSWDRYGRVPRVRWGRASSRMDVGWSCPDYRYDFLRTRVAIVSKPSSSTLVSSDLKQKLETAKFAIEEALESLN